ncbi:GIN domain-containing protein [Entomospira culicis]|uniref:Putative auto-transporter adhesin head GIN domain-containing protein n=1 Tax=Entomospira culicis TaxID=2719989 RepID=A0A968GF35_9SPIO|nr:DUF2807 domain-containing protein [Entomospira culicis]NIZ18455.1 hypothetical protein [Entomospira culicis]NIZ68671.1 hypothetical protein [Entomospira culicis]WDI37270.1 DUF2807 domain-containing protein [Entomospira culicis]WDI38899.1 DUF2807 domain-containing protein [Entomospira culicis]
MYSKYRLLVVALFALLSSCLSMGPELSIDEDSLLAGEELVDLSALGSYSKIIVQGPFNITLSNMQGIASNMKAPLLERVEFSVKEDTLYIIPSRRFFPYPTDEILFSLGLDGLDEVTLQIDGNVSTRGILRMESLSLHFEGNSKGLIHSEVEKLSISSRSPGRIVLIGQAKVLETRLFPKSLLSLRSFRAEELIFHNDNGSQVLMPR